MRKLFLDDCRKAPDFTWDVVRSYDQFVAYIELHGVPDIISFDHDLGDEHYLEYERNLLETEPKILYESFTEKTGYDCAKWLVERGHLPEKYYVHSLNPVGAQNIRFVMERGYTRALHPIGQD